MLRREKNCPIEKLELDPEVDLNKQTINKPVIILDYTLLRHLVRTIKRKFTWTLFVIWINERTLNSGH